MKKLEEKVLVTKSFLPPRETFDHYLNEIWSSHWLTNNGPLHQKLEVALNQKLKVKNSALFTNGHLALDVAIKALDLKGEVITTPFTFASTTHAIVSNGLTPVFCDINDSTYTIDVDKIESLITERTCAIVAVHVYGNPCDVYKIDEIANKHNLKVIYDAAHVFGVEVDGKGIGSFGDISMFSLPATKVFNSIEGGLLTFGDRALKAKFESLKNFGIVGQEEVEYVGINAKMNEFQAAMGLSNLEYLDDQISKRKLVADLYRTLLKDVKSITCLGDIDNVKHNYAYFPILINPDCGINRDDLFNELGKLNIFSRKYFYPLTKDFACYKGLYTHYQTPIASYVSKNILALPMYGELDLDDVKVICENIIELIENGAH